MNNKLLMLGLVIGLMFAGCQKDEVSENIQSQTMITAKKEKTAVVSDQKIHEPDWLQGPGAEIHEPPLTSPIGNIHEPDWFMINGWFNCTGDEYSGDSNISVNRQHELSICEDHLDIDLKNLNIGGTFNLFVESLSVENTVNLHRNGVFNFIGDITIGTEDEPEDLVINYGSHFVFMGNVHVTGQLIINNGGTFELKGEEASYHTYSADGGFVIDEGAIIIDHCHHTHED